MMISIPTNALMKMGSRVLVSALVLASLTSPRTALGHCDQLDGPVIKDARSALEAGDVTPVLKWIGSEDEAEIRGLFEKAVSVRATGDEAMELADMYFFETLVRIHRASEGESYTGLKPAGTPLEPGVAMADEALDSGSADEMIAEITKHAEKQLREKFEAAREAKAHAQHTVEYGREYVAAYVMFVHYTKGLVEALEGHGPHAHTAHEAPHAAMEHSEVAPAHTVVGETRHQAMHQ